MIGPKSATWARDAEKPKRPFRPRVEGGPARTPGPRTGGKPRG